MKVGDIRNELYSKEVNNVNCENCEEIYMPHTQNYKLKYILKILCFKLRIIVNKGIEGGNIFCIIGTVVTLQY